MHRMLDKYRPDCLLVAETACPQTSKIIIPHDDYSVMYQPINVEKKCEALG